MKLLRLTLGLLILGLGSGSAVAQNGPDKAARKEAEEHFVRGVEHHDNADYRAALIEFKQAYRIAPTYHLLYNLGQESVELRNYVDAHAYFLQYLSDGGSKVSKERRESVLLEISRVEKYISTLAFATSVDGAEVAVDGIVVGVTPLEAPVKVSVGRHRVVITSAGYAGWERTIDVAGGEEKAIAATLLATSTTTTTVPGAFVTAEPAEEGQSTAFWISASTTGVAAISTGVLLLLTKTAKDDYDAELNGAGESPELKLAALDAAGSDYKRMALYTDIAIGVTLASAVTTFFLAGSDDEKSSPKAVSMQFGLGSMAISGEF